VAAADARTILEIGAEFGVSTNVLLDYIRQVDGHLHSIDPLPEFDADQLQRDNSGILTLYRDLSLNVLPGLPPVDVALVDGDHNWYTVYHELKLIEQIHGHDPLHQPLVFVHDTGWPYGRRDLYYDPSTIPEAFRHEYQRKGIFPRRKELADEGGMNLEHDNAVREGGERNGVLTGLEDYLAQSSLDYCFVNLPFYHGLGILVTRQRLAACPALQQEIDKLQQALQGEELISMAEHMRCTEGLIRQTLARRLLASEQREARLQAELDILRSGSGGGVPARES
jgi:hypothetical protein